MIPNLMTGMISGIVCRVWSRLGGKASRANGEEGRCAGTADLRLDCNDSRQKTTVDG